MDNTAQKTEEAGPSLPTFRNENNIVNQTETHRQQNADRSIAKLASSVQNLTEIVMGLTKAQKHSGSGEGNNAKRKETHNQATQVHQKPQTHWNLAHQCM